MWLPIGSSAGLDSRARSGSGLAGVDVSTDLEVHLGTTPASHDRGRGGVDDRGVDDVERRFLDGLPREEAASATVTSSAPPAPGLSPESEMKKGRSHLGSGQAPFHRGDGATNSKRSWTSQKYYNTLGLL